MIGVNGKHEGKHWRNGCSYCNPPTQAREDYEYKSEAGGHSSKQKAPEENKGHRPQGENMDETGASDGHKRDLKDKTGDDRQQRPFSVV